MISAAYFEHDLHTCLAHVQIDSFAHMLDFDQVRAVLGEECEQAGESTWSVADSGEHNQPSATQSLVPSYQPGEEPEIGISP
jgi:hypothetical protein